MKVVEERDQEITTLREKMQTCETAKSSQSLVVKVSDKRERCDARKPTTTTISFHCFSLSSATTGYDHELYQSSVWKPVLDFFHVL